MERTLAERGKKAELSILAEAQPGAGATSFTRQQSPLGLGHAVWCARDLVGNEPFAVLLPDMLIKGAQSCLAQMVDARRDLGDDANIIATEEVPEDQTHMYGIVGLGKPKGKTVEITEMVEKPPRGKAPSNLIITGRYILQPEIFGILENQQSGAGGEIQLTDAMITLMKSSPFYSFKFDGRTYDCGSKLGFLAANVAYALDREDLAPGLREELKRLLG